jgi:hypothetical protein
LWLHTDQTLFFITLSYLMGWCKNNCQCDQVDAS